MTLSWTKRITAKNAESAKQPRVSEVPDFLGALGELGG
jgi:hypothetical protein